MSELFIVLEPPRTGLKWKAKRYLERQNSVQAEPGCKEPVGGWIKALRMDFCYGPIVLHRRRPDPHLQPRSSLAVLKACNQKMMILIFCSQMQMN